MSQNQEPPKRPNPRTAALKAAVNYYLNKTPDFRAFIMTLDLSSEDEKQVLAAGDAVKDKGIAEAEKMMAATLHALRPDLDDAVRNRTSPGRA